MDKFGKLGLFIIATGVLFLKAVYASVVCRLPGERTPLISECDNECCEYGCCVEEDYKTILVILGCVFGGVVISATLTILLICLTKKRWPRRVKPVKDGEIEENGLHIVEPIPGIS